MLPQRFSTSLEVPPVVPFADDVWFLTELVDDETRDELKASREALDRSQAFSKELVGFNPPPE